MMNQSQPVVLVAPLNWGLGHATRCIPVISELLRQNCKVIICGNGESFSLLQAEFPECLHFRLPDYSIRYSGVAALFPLRMLLHFPFFFNSIRKDFCAAKEIIKQYAPCLLISDSRYGFRNPGVFSVLLTHQIEPILPGFFHIFSGVFKKKYFRFLNRFNEVWVPDFIDSPNLSGKLSHHTGYSGVVNYSGPLSRFSEKLPLHDAFKYDILAIISGPEPQRQKFEDFCMNLVKHSDKKLCIIAGKPSEKKTFSDEQITYFSHLDTLSMAAMIEHSEIIIARSGYSTIMDLFVLGKKALIVPTPGQTEQEYLAEHNSGNGLFLEFDPGSDNIEECIVLLRNMKMQKNNNANENFLKNNISETLTRVNVFHNNPVKK